MSETPTADSNPGTCEFTSADLDMPNWRIETLGLIAWNCSYPVWDDDRCVWHADATDKPSEELAATVEDGELHGAQLSNVDLSEGSVLSGIQLVNADLSDANLCEADLSDANLHGVDFSEANLHAVDLSEANLREVDLSEKRLCLANFSEANLVEANLSRANLAEADLSRANLAEADLSRANLAEADLRGADLSNKNLSGVNLYRADLRGVSMVGVRANQSTTVGRMRTGFQNPDAYDELAQGYHELKEALSEEGLSQRTRQARALEQQARTAESWARFKRHLNERVTPGRTVEGVNQWRNPTSSDSEIQTQFLTAVGGTLSRYLTGYGTRPLYVLLWTAAIVFLTTALFALGPAPPDGGWQGGPFYYSVVTFVTAPPHPPKDVWTVTQAAVLLETYLGTVLTVLLGYVLSTREQV